MVNAAARAASPEGPPSHDPVGQRRSPAHPRIVKPCAKGRNLELEASYSRPSYVVKSTDFLAWRMLVFFFSRLFFPKDQTEVEKQHKKMPLESLKYSRHGTKDDLPSLMVLDQLGLPERMDYCKVETVQEAAEMIISMKVRLFLVSCFLFPAVSVVRGLQGWRL